MEPFQQLTGDLWLIEAAPTDNEPAVSKGFIVDATANREQSDTAAKGLNSLLGQSKTYILHCFGGPALVLTE